MPSELRSKARARDSRSRDRRRRRGSRDRDRGAHRDRDANRTNEPQPPFSIFPRLEPQDSQPSLRLTPNTQHRSRSQERSPSRAYEQDLATWHNIDAPPILRRVPLQAVPVEPPPVAMTIHPNRSVQFDINRAPPREEQDFFCRLLQSINPSGPSQFAADPPVNIQYFQPQRQVLPSSDSRTPPAPRGRSPTPSTNAPQESRDLSPFLTFSDLVNTRHPRVVLKLIFLASQTPAFQLAPALNGLTNWNNRKMDTVALPWTVQIEIPTRSSSVSSPLKIALEAVCSRWTSTFLGSTIRSENSAIANKLHTRWSTFGSKNHTAG